MLNISHHKNPRNPPFVLPMFLALQLSGHSGVGVFLFLSASPSLEAKRSSGPPVGKELASFHTVSGEDLQNEECATRCCLQSLAKLVYK